MSNTRYCIICGKEFQALDPDAVLCPEHAHTGGIDLEKDKAQIIKSETDKPLKPFNLRIPYLGPSAAWLEIYNMHVKQDVDGLMRALICSADIEMRRYAALALGSLGDQRANPTLQQAMQDEDDLVRFHASCALARLGDFQVMLQFLGDERPPFLPGMQLLNFDPWEWVRPYGHAAVEDILNELAHPLNFVFLRIAADFIIQFKDHSLVPVLWDCLQHEDYRIRTVAAHKLGSLPEDGSCERLIPLLGDEIDVVAERAADALRMIGRPALPALEKVKSGAMRARVLDLITQIKEGRK